MKTENTRDKLIAISIHHMGRQGFNNTGIAEILASARVPKGSFYHYFKSKDELGLAIIDHYAQQLQDGLKDYLINATGSALKRLRGYFEYLLAYFGNDFRLCNCLLGNLGQELAMQNDSMRSAIYSHYRAIEAIIADCLRQAKAEGELAEHKDVQTLAKLIFSSWEGCLVRARLEQSPESLHQLIHFYFDEVLPTTPARS